MFPKCEWKSFHWTSLFLSWTNCQLLQDSWGISENEKIQPKNLQNGSLGKMQDSRYMLLPTSGSLPTGVLGGRDVAQIPCIYREDGGSLVFHPVTLNSCESSEFSCNSVQECSPVFQELCSTFGCLGKDQRSTGNKWFPMHIEFPLLLLFPLSLEIQYWQDSRTSP